MESKRRNTLFEIGTLYSEAEQAVEAGKAFDAAFVRYRESADQLKEYPSSYTISTKLLRIADNFATSDKQKAIAIYEETLKLSIDNPSLIYSVNTVMQSLAQLYLEMKTEEGNAKARKVFQTVIDAYAARKTDNEADLRRRSVTSTRKWATKLTRVSS